jgi:hypothetical protein
MHDRRTMLCVAALIAIATLLPRTGRAEDATSPDRAAAVAPSPRPARPLGPGAPAVAKSAPKKPAKETPTGIRLSPVTPVASASVNEKALEACNLQTLLPQSIAQRNPDVELSDAPGGAMKLDMKIVDVHAPGGGVFSGPKWITVEGRLLQGKTVKGSFLAKETSMGSATACGMLGKVVSVLAADIAEWLQHPEKGSMLGRAR